MPRFYCPEPLQTGAQLDLPASAARHVQVLRMQPGQSLTLFPGAEPHSNAQYQATIVQMGRQNVRVHVDSVEHADREARPAIHLLAGMPANERMDWLVEKATELGAACITPIAAERSMLRLKGERAEKKQAHWQAIAIAACEQSGRNTVPTVAASISLKDWLQAQPAPDDGHAVAVQRLVLTPQGAQHSLAQWWQQRQGSAAEGSVDAVQVLTGPEGGLSEAELQMAVAHGFVPVSLGARILRSETAPLACLALLTAV